MPEYQAVITSKGFFSGDTWVLRYQNEISPLNEVFCLLHGFPSNNQKNYDLAELLCRIGYTVYLFHFDGLGNSKGQFSFFQSFDVIRNVLILIQDLDANQKLSMLAHSWGAYVALATFGQLNPRNLLVLLAPYSTLPEGEQLNRLANTLKTDCPSELQHMSVNEIAEDLRNVKQNYPLISTCKTIDPNRTLIVKGKKDTEISATMIENLMRSFSSTPTLHLIEDDHLFSSNRKELKRIIYDWTSDKINK